MKFFLLLIQILNVLGANDVGWPQEKEFSWAKEVPEMNANEVFALQGQSLKTHLYLVTNSKFLKPTVISKKMI